MGKKYAAFVTVLLPDGQIAATTRAADRNEAGRIGLPGGKRDPGETLSQTAIREAMEEGWEVAQIDAEPFHIAMIGEFECHWFRGSGATQLSAHKEKGRISPIAVPIADLMSPELGNDRAMAEFRRRYMDPRIPEAPLREGPSL